MKSFKRPGYYWLLQTDMYPHSDGMYIVYPNRDYEFLAPNGHATSSKTYHKIKFGMLPWHSKATYLGPL